MSETKHVLNDERHLANRQRKKESNDFVERIMSIFRPKLVMPGYEDMTIPEDVRNAILIERMILAKTGEKLATETEALWYLSTASLISPLDNHWYNIFLYLFNKYCLRLKKELPSFAEEPVILDKYLEERELYNLRKWIYVKGMEAMKNMGRKTNHH